MLRGDEFWCHMEHASNTFEEPALISSAGFDVAAIEEDIRDVLLNLPSEACEFVRAYVGGRQCYQLERRLTQAPPAAEEPLSEWCARLSDEKNIGFVLNDATRWSERLARRCARTAAPVLAKFPSPQLALDGTLFIGDYGFTPFGAHVDDPHHRTVHLHLGPESKDFYFWHPEEFCRLTNEQSASKNFAKLIEHSKTLTANPGDALLVPSRFVHMARTRGFSVGLALILSKTSHATAFSEATRSALSRMKEQLARVSPTSTKLTPEPISYIATPLDFGTQTVYEWVGNLMEEYILRKTSNCGLRSPPPERSAPPSQDLWKLDAQRVEPFPIEMRRSEHEITLFVRHRKLTMRRFPEVEQLLGILNTQSRVPVRTLIGELSSLSADATLGVLRDIYRLNGIDFHRSTGMT